MNDEDLTLTIDKNRPGVAMTDGGDSMSWLLLGMRARRIVACVNACDGASTEILEALAADEKTVPGMLAFVAAERDELRAALVAVTTAIDLTAYGAALHDARAVLKKIGADISTHNVKVSGARDDAR